jgi:hypothetical protein
LDWLVLAVWLGAVLATVLLFPGNHVHIHGVDDAPHAGFLPAGGPTRATHEVTWLMAVFALLYWIGQFLQRLPWVDRLLGLFRKPRTRDMRALFVLPPVERAHAAAIWGLVRVAGGQVGEADIVRDAMRLPDLHRRARRIGLLARGRFGGDPFRRDSAHARAALLLWDIAPPGAVGHAATEALHSPLGMAASEPGWVRLLDGTLLAAALQAKGRPDATAGWQEALGRWFGLSNRRRPSARQQLLGLAPVSAQAWEHAAATAIALACGWIAPQKEWSALRRQVLGAVGRGGRSIADNRLAAAGRCWAVQVQDEEVLSLLRRVSVSERDPLAKALDALAATLEGNLESLRPHQGRAALASA